MPTGQALCFCCIQSLDGIHAYQCFTRLLRSEALIANRSRRMERERERVFAPWLFSIIPHNLLCGPWLSGNQLEYVEERREEWYSMYTYGINVGE